MENCHDLVNYFEIWHGGSSDINLNIPDVYNIIQ